MEAIHFLILRWCIIQCNRNVVPEWNIEISIDRRWQETTKSRKEQRPSSWKLYVNGNQNSSSIFSQPDRRDNRAKRKHIYAIHQWQSFYRELSTSSISFERGISLSCLILDQWFSVQQGLSFRYKDARVPQNLLYSIREPEKTRGKKQKRLCWHSLVLVPVHGCPSRRSNLQPYSLIIERCSPSFHHCFAETEAISIRVIMP